MNKFFVMCVSVVAALAVAAPEAEAEHGYKKKRRPSFLEALFGGFDRPRQQPRNRAWWEDGEEGVRIIQRTKPVQPKKLAKKLVPKPFIKTAYVDPEVAEGLGMGNLVYAPPKLNPVVDPSFKSITTLTPETGAIRLVLSDRKTNIRAVPAIQKLVLDHYKSTGFSPVWSKGGRLSDRALTVLALLAAAKSEGLDPERYLPTALESYGDIAQQLDDDPLALAELDISLTINAIIYATHVSGGAFEPASLSGYHDLQNRRVDPAIALRVLAYSGFPAEYIKGLSPTHPAYAQLKAELARLDDPALVVELFPSGGRVKPGQKDQRIPLLRQRMVKEGFLDSEAALVENELLLDKQLSKAMKAFQAVKGLQQTGALDVPTMKSLSGLDPAVARERVISSLERLRWMRDDFGTRHVFVNQASYRVDVMDQGKPVWTSKVIVGKPLTQTAVFSDQMETVVFNPAWNLPQSILLNEYLPKLRRDSRYLDKIGFKVLNSKGEVTKSSSVNWASVGSDTVIGVQQPPGGANALGEIKFLFPNKHSIYMHDTPNRELFAQGRRNFSHGCVRVENPREFAQVLLGWDAAMVDGKIDSGESTSEKLGGKIQVHLTYFTAWPGHDGKIQYFADPYGRDSTLLQARTTMQKQYARKRSFKIVENQTISKSSAID